MREKKIKTEIDGIIVEGNKKFLTQTKKALSLLRKSVPFLYKRVILTGIKKIRPHKTSGMNVFAKIPTFEVGETTAFYSLKWYASVMAHEACHSKTYFGYKKKYKKRVPIKVYKSQKAELECIKFQIKVAKQIKLSILDIKYLESLDGSHAKLSKISW